MDYRYEASFNGVEKQNGVLLHQKLLKAITEVMSGIKHEDFSFNLVDTAPIPLHSYPESLARIPPVENPKFNPLVPTSEVNAPASSVYSINTFAVPSVVSASAGCVPSKPRMMKFAIITFTQSVVFMALTRPVLSFSAISNL